ncbi:hypothetical protein Tco_1072241 [Tanacetum coccineum]
MMRTLGDRLSMVYTGDDGQALFTSHAWMRLFEVRGPLVKEFMLEFFSTCRMSDTEIGLDEEMAEAGFGAYWSGSERVIPDKGDLRDYWMEISSDKDFLGPAPSYVFIRDPVRRLCHRMIAYIIFGRGQAPEMYLFRHTEGRKSGARLLGGHFIGRLAAHFGLVSDQGLRGLSVLASELPLIDLCELGRLNICSRLVDTWAWVVPGPKRQQAATAGTPGAAEDAPVADEGAQAVPAPVQAPQPPPPAPQHRTISITEQTRVSTWMISCMTQLMDASGRTYQAFDSTLVGSSHVPYQRRVRPRTGDASTFTAPHTDD